MSHLPPEVLQGLQDARRDERARHNRLRVQSGDGVFPVIGLRSNGFVVDPDIVPHLRGLVDLFDGGRHIASCLIVASERDGETRVYEYKRKTESAVAPAADFVRDDSRPVALLT